MPRVSDSDAKALLAMQAELKRLATKVDNFRGDGVVNNRYSLSIARGRGGKGGRSQEADSGLWMRIDAHTQDGSNKRWTYDVTQVNRTGSLTWGEPDNPLTGKAENSIESGNGSAGIYGNGVTATNLTGTFDLVPIGNDAIVWCRFVETVAGVAYYVFEAVNQVDGAC